METTISRCYVSRREGICPQRCGISGISLAKKLNRKLSVDLNANCFGFVTILFVEHGTLVLSLSNKSEDEH